MLAKARQVLVGELALAEIKDEAKANELLAEVDANQDGAGRFGLGGSSGLQAGGRSAPKESWLRQNLAALAQPAAPGRREARDRFRLQAGSGGWVRPFRAEKTADEPRHAMRRPHGDAAAHGRGKISSRENHPHGN